MKKIITLVCCIGSTLLMAQNNAIQTTELAPNWALMLSNLNTTQITSGILYDKSGQFENLFSYNLTENNMSSSDKFNEAMNELYLASDQTRFISNQELINRTATTTQTNTVDVGIINTSIQKLNFNEKYPNDGGLLFQNGKFVVIPNKPSFLTRKAFIVSPLKEIISGSNAVFKFSNNLLFNNGTSVLKNLVVDFGNGVNVTVVSNGIILISQNTVTYSNSGSKFIKFVATFADNTSVTTYATIYFDYKTTNQTQATLPCYESLKDKGSFSSNISFKGYEETSPVFGKMEYTIFYHNNAGNTQKKILKPIVIIDGFDPADKRKVLDCDCENDPVCFLTNSVITGNVTSGFIRTFSPTKHISIEDFNYYDDIDPLTGDAARPNLIPKLRSLGYDVIIINHPVYTTTNVAGQTVAIDGGSDYIERNALTLVSYIQNLNSILTTNGSTEKLAIVGPSMGGQISRYALAYMDKKFGETSNPIWKHNTRLWISVDSPHLGANIPLSAQANVWFLGYKMGKIKAKKQFDNELNSTAAKQQLISQFKQALNTGYSDNSPFFNTFYSNMNSNGLAGSNGYPVTTSTFRKIALVNGSLSGTKVGTEKQTFLKMRGYIDLSFLFFNWSITLLRLNDMFMPASGDSGTIFQGDGVNFNIGFDHWTINLPRYSVFATNNSIKGSLDVIPGGLFSTQKYIKEGVEEGLRDAGVRSQTSVYLPAHSFIPAFSALGHLQPNQNWGNALNANLKCPTNNLTPFDSYYGESTNSQHTSFNKDSVAWLLKELNNQPQLPNYPLVDVLLTGADKICLNTNTTYAFTNPCMLPSVVVNWSVTPNLQIVSQSSYSITVLGIENGTGEITATFQNGKKIIKTVHTGAPTFSNFTFDSSPHTICVLPIYNFTFSSQDLNLHDRIKANFNGLTPADIALNSNWEWQTYNSLIAITGSTNARSICSISPGVTGLKVRVKNICGWSDWVEFPFEIFETPGPLGKQSAPKSFYTVYPNPSNNIVYVDLRDQNNQPKTHTLITAELFDILGQPKGKVDIVDNKAIIDVKKLPKGIYILKININDKVEGHQISVQ